MSRFGKRVSRNEVIEILAAAGVTLAEAQKALQAAEEKEVDFFAFDQEQAIFIGSSKCKNFIVNAFFVFERQLVEKTDIYDLPWGEPSWYTVI